MGSKNHGPKLVELWTDPEEVVIQHDEDGVFATDRYVLWRLNGLQLADTRLVPEPDGFYRIGKTRVTRLGKRIDPKRFGHLAEKFGRWAAEDADRNWQPVQLTSWSFNRFRVGVSDGGPVLIGACVADLCERHDSFALSVHHSGGEDYKLRITWTSRVWRHADFGGDYDQHTAVGIVQPGSIPDSEQVSAVLDIIARAQATEDRVPA
jgi:hypothetical protein